MEENYEQIIDDSIESVLCQLADNGGQLDNEHIQSIVLHVKQLLLNNCGIGLDRIMDVLIEDYVRLNEKMVDDGLTPGIASAIKIKNGPEVEVYRGYTSTNENKQPINSSTRFDMASVTKLFTALQLLKDQELNMIDLNKTVKQLDPEFNLDITLNELLRFYHEIRTNGRIENQATKEEAIELLKNPTVARSGVYVYSDIPYMIAKLITPNANEDFVKYFNQELGLTNTGYEVNDSDVITGSFKDQMDMIHDPKARIIDHAGHAGVYSTARDMIKLSDELGKLTFLNMDTILELIRPIIKNDYVSQVIKKDDNGNDVIGDVAVTRGMLYKQHSLGLQKTEVMPAQGKHAMAITGFTGTWVNMDIDNGMYSTILTNPLSGDGKVKGYVWKLDELKQLQFDTMVKLMMVVKVYENYYGKTETFESRISR